MASVHDVIRGIIIYTMSNTFKSVEQMWESLLSREPGAVSEVFSTLDEEEQAAVLAHLRKMTCEPGWHPEQKKSAEAALGVLKGLTQ